jgi:hypothetical protein
MLKIDGGILSQLPDLRRWVQWQRTMSQGWFPRVERIQ